mmetsp:Transcript_25169/g.81194  ORF Transcript_25169/g.81194 Transcript_25169/m.81194 type:complete len:270 (+) Transcript_25169:15-824(+)
MEVESEPAVPRDGASTVESEAKSLLDEAGKEMAAFPSRSVLPGDDITDSVLQITAEVRIGDGLAQRGDSLVVTKAGLLKFRPPNRFWVDTPQKRYDPVVGDMVVGVVRERGAEEYQVDIGAPFPALLPALAFDGASKRNKPNLQVGDVVYARVATAHRHLEPELSCLSIGGKKKDWVTGESMFGQLKGGHMFEVSLQHARRLRRPDCKVLHCLGASVPFEIAAGTNGRVWVQSTKPQHVVVVSNAVLNAEQLDDAAIQVMVDRLLSALH